MIRKTILFCVLPSLGLLIHSCGKKPEATDPDPKQTIEKAEKDFEKMAAEKGIAEAFWYYADSNAVIKRQNDTLIKGKENIRNYYSTDFYKNAKVTWSPDFIEVSNDGTMAYTYGNYIWRSTDSTNKPLEFKGVFHTVWKKQADGSWKYVWD